MFFFYKMVILNVVEKPCGQCCEYLNKLQSTLSPSLDGKNLEAVLTEVGILFHGYPKVITILLYIVAWILCRPSVACSSTT
jgi:hypothetical protein